MITWNKASDKEPILDELIIVKFKCEGFLMGYLTKIQNKKGISWQIDMSGNRQESTSADFWWSEINHPIDEME